MGRRAIFIVGVGSLLWLCLLILVTYSSKFYTFESFQDGLGEESGLRQVASDDSFQPLWFLQVNTRRHASLAKIFIHTFIDL